MTQAAASRKVPTTLRRQVLGNEPTCHWCGFSGDPSDFDADHLIPVSLKGPTTLGNLVAACASCNRRRQASTGSPWWADASRSLRMTAMELADFNRGLMAQAFARARAS